MSTRTMTAWRDILWRDGRLARPAVWRPGGDARLSTRTTYQNEYFNEN
jgi:hypothetical protein